VEFERFTVALAILRPDAPELDQEAAAAFSATRFPRSVTEASS